MYLVASELPSKQKYFKLGGITMSYIDLIKDKARADLKTIVLPETRDKRTLIAASKIIEEVSGL